jgi:hypothetical protein
MVAKDWLLNYPQSCGEKLHSNPLTTQTCLNTKNTSSTRLQVISPKQKEEPQTTIYLELGAWLK